MHGADETSPLPLSPPFDPEVAKVLPALRELYAPLTFDTLGARRALTDERIAGAAPVDLTVGGVVKVE